MKMMELSGSSVGSPKLISLKLTNPNLTQSDLWSYFQITFFCYRLLINVQSMLILQFLNFELNLIKGLFMLNALKRRRYLDICILLLLILLICNSLIKALQCFQNKCDSEYLCFQTDIYVIALDLKAVFKAL